MELRVLRYFLATAREGSILGAARFLHVTQPTLSRQLQELEEELGQKLLIRSNRHITLTPEGKLFRKRAEDVMEIIKKRRRNSVPWGRPCAAIFTSAAEKLTR